MATYSSFKKIDTDAIVSATVASADIAANTITATNITDANVPAAAFSGTVTSAKIASTIDLSGKTVTYRAIVNGDISATAAIAGAKLASGAATNNLGFTPINRAGDTLTGQLLVPSGSVAAPSIVSSGDTASGINITSNNVNIVAGGVSGINVNSSGFATRPNNPAFLSWANAGWLYGGSYGGTGEYECGSIMGWSNAFQTGGTNFANANGRFTAPVAGYYHFSTWWYLLNDANTPPGYIHPFFRKNNSRGWTSGGRSPYLMAMHQNTNQYDDGYSHTAVIDMNAGDYVSIGIVWHNTSASRHHAAHQYFSGALIG
jgi:hypothetical protein